MAPTPIFVRRQSPDWKSLSQDFRSGLAVDPRRYAPSHPIPGFPRNISALVEQWNQRFKIDFFTCRRIVADLSDKNIRAIPEASRFQHHQKADIVKLAENHNFFAFFHDDDDFFAPGLTQILADISATESDALVFPLFRVNNDLFTFVKDGYSADFVWGRRQSFHFRFQTNNYAINSRICSEAALSALQDHVLASGYADKQGLTETVLSPVISATVKTPCSASILPIVFGNESALRSQFEGFFEKFANPDLPSGYSWIIDPLKKISRLLDSVYQGHGYDAIADLIPDSEVYPT
jgi:hypothetical protein